MYWWLIQLTCLREIPRTERSVWTGRIAPVAEQRGDHAAGDPQFDLVLRDRPKFLVKVEPAAGIDQDVDDVHGRHALGDHLVERAHFRAGFGALQSFQRELAIDDLGVGVVGESAGRPCRSSFFRSTLSLAKCLRLDLDTRGHAVFGQFGGQPLIVDEVVSKIVEALALGYEQVAGFQFVADAIEDGQLG